VPPNWDRMSGVETVILPGQGHRFADTRPLKQPRKSVDSG
jgi:hypothetical protein